MQRMVYVTFVTVVSLLAAFNVVSLQVQAQTGDEVTLYLYGSQPTSVNGYFSTDPPSSSMGESNHYGASGGIIFRYVLGTWESVPLQKNIHISGQVTVSVWLVNDDPLPAQATVTCDFLIDEADTGQSIESDAVILGNTPTELTFSGYVDLYLSEGERFGIYMTVKYIGEGFTFYWASSNWDSRIIVPANWVLLNINDAEVNNVNKEVMIEAEVRHALGVEEIVDYGLQISGPSDASTISGPSLSADGDAMIATWIWYYGQDGAANGSYQTTVTVTDNSGNDWSQSEPFEIGGTQPPPTDNWTVIKQVTINPASDNAPYLMIDNNGDFWLAFGSDRNDNMDIFIIKSSDGLSWVDPIQVTTNESDDGIPCLIQDSGGTFW